MSDPSSRGRRDFCRKVTTATGLFTLGGCLGRNENSGVTTRSGPAGNEQFRAEFGLPEPKAGIETDLNVLQWTNYWHPNTVRDFEDAYGVSVQVQDYGSNEELYQILDEEGLDTWDLVVPSDWMISRLIGEGLLQPVETDRLENWSNLADRWMETAPYDTGSHRHSVPYMWGTTGLAWHQQLVDRSLSDIDVLDSWDAMWTEEYANQIQMLQLPRELYAAPLKRLGYSLNTTDEDEIAEATELLVQQKDFVDEYVATGLIDDLINRRATPIQTYSGDALTAGSRLSTDESSPVVYRIPKEGGVQWVDGMALTARAQHPNAALTFVDYLLDSTVAARNANFTFYATPNDAAREDVVQPLRENDAVYPPERVRDNLEFIENVGAAEDYYQDGWETVRSA